jgi:hypothetical protein
MTLLAGIALVFWWHASAAQSRAAASSQLGTD